VSEEEVRVVLKADKHSGFQSLGDDEAETDFMNVDKMKAGAKMEAAEGGEGETGGGNDAEQDDTAIDPNLAMAQQKHEQQMQHAQEKHEMQMRHSEEKHTRTNTLELPAKVQGPELAQELGQLESLLAQMRPSAPANSTQQLPAIEQGEPVARTSVLPDIERLETLLGGLRAPELAPKVPSNILQNVQQLENILAGMKQGSYSAEPNFAKELPGVKESTNSSTEPSTSAGVKGLRDSVGPIEDAETLPKMKVHGLNIAIENPKGSVRKGIDLDGRRWNATMPAHYGFIKGTRGADGDAVDCFVNSPATGDKVYVINQNRPEDGAFDEHKCMLGYPDAQSAQDSYKQAFDSDWGGFGSIHELDIPAFKNWLSTGDMMKPYAGDSEPPVMNNLPENPDLAFPTDEHKGND
jgi:hypothetical protein